MWNRRDLQDYECSALHPQLSLWQPQSPSYSFLFAEMVKHEEHHVLRLELYFDGFLGYDTV
jgi:hypothetical protein